MLGPSPHDPDSTDGCRHFKSGRLNNGGGGGKKLRMPPQMLRTAKGKAACAAGGDSETLNTSLPLVPLPAVGAHVLKGTGIKKAPACLVRRSHCQSSVQMCTVEAFSVDKGDSFPQGQAVVPLGTGKTIRQQALHFLF